MEGYPEGSLALGAPLLIASGLTPPSEPTSLGDPRLKETAIQVRSDLPAVEGPEAEVILEHLQASDASNLPWNGRHPRRHKFRIKTCGRTFLLPPRSARTPEGFAIDVDAIPQSPPVLHSPFSPLSPISHLYPDGLIDARWIQKHHDLIPSVYLCFYSLTNDPSIMTQWDNKMRSDMASIRNTLSQSGYKTRLVIVIVGDHTSSIAPDKIQERVETIRRGTGLDHKTFLYIPPQESDDQLEAAMDAILGSLFTQAQDYYRDLVRHAKKKRGRGIAPQPTVPPTSGTSRTLSVQAWNLRYDFKTAFFSECRQEMDLALRSYESAYEILFSSDIWEIIPNWSPRWNEARTLADMIAIRALRCLQWIGQWSASVRRWRQHRDRIQDLVDRRGYGTENYGWEAWQARWATVMSQLIQRVDIVELAPEKLVIFMPPEKVVAAERLQPWEQLHHPGYWHRTAARHLVARRNRAHMIPDDDRNPPDWSPASKVANRPYAYDTYMCPEPHEEYPVKGGTNHSLLILEALDMAREEFLKRQQHRMAAELALDSARELMGMGDHETALELLKPMWDDMTFRAEGWWDISESLSWMLRSAAKRARLPDLIIAIDWELLNRNFTRNKNWEYDISRALDGLTLSEKPSVTITDENVLSFLTSSFVFRSEEAKAGETCLAQLSFASNAFAGSAPIVLQTVEVHFEGSIKPLVITHKPATEKRRVRNNVAISATPLTEGDSTEDSGSDGEEVIASLSGEDDLTIHPGQTRVFEMAIPLREPGDAAATALKMTLVTDTFSLEYETKLRESTIPDVWHTLSAMKKRLSRTHPHSIHILPRPPKMEVKLVNTKDQYYTDEVITLDVELKNAEDADAVTKLEVQAWGSELPAVKLRAGDQEKECPEVEADTKGVSIHLGKLESGKSSIIQIVFGAADHALEYGIAIKASYHLVTDPATPILQDDEYRLIIINPFEANYELVPRLHNDPWPSLFDHSTLVTQTRSSSVTSSKDAVKEGGGQDPSVQPRGLSQKWLLSTRYASFANEDLRITDLDVVVLKTHGSVHCGISKRQEVPEEGRVIVPKTMDYADFDVVSQRLSLDDPPGQASMEVSFVIRWKRIHTRRGEEKGDYGGEGGKEVDEEGEDGGEVNTTALPAPRLFVSGSEPRVISTVEYLSVAGGGFVEDAADEGDTDKASSIAPSGGPAGGKTKSTGDVASTITPSLLFSPPIILLTVVIENPSHHFLTFGVTMDPSDEFAFSGPKSHSLNLLPVSRRSVRYRIMPLVEGGGGGTIRDGEEEDGDGDGGGGEGGESGDGYDGRGYWIRPGLTVRDKYFQKVLRVLPTEGMRADKDGAVGIWVPE